MRNVRSDFAMSLERLGRWIKKTMKKDPLESKPLLKDNFVTYFSFSDKEKAYLSDIISRETFMEIDRSGHDALELADGKRTIREIAMLVYEKYSKRYNSIASVEKEMLSFIQMLYDKKLIELIDHG